MSDSEPTPKSWKSWIADEMKEYYFNFLFLAFYFVSFASYRRLLLEAAHAQLPILGWWAPLIEAAILAKVVMIGDAFHLGRRFNYESLLATAFVRTWIFGLFAGVCKVLESFVEGHLHHLTMAESLHRLANQGWPEILGSSLIVVVAFFPFFCYKELEGLIGKNKLRGLLFGARLGPADPLRAK